MEQQNSFSLIKRYDGSYIYLLELHAYNEFYKYMIATWVGNHISEPFMIYSHTKRSALPTVEKEYFDNNLLERTRINKYLGSHNLYIGGISRAYKRPVREFKEGIVIPRNYKVYLRDDNYILIEKTSDGNLKSYVIHEFFQNENYMDYDSTRIYSELDLLNLGEEKEYVINSLLNKDRVKKKCEEALGYVGSVTNVNGEYKKTYDEATMENLKRRI